MDIMHYDNGFGVPACGHLSLRPISLTRNPDYVACIRCEVYIPATAPYQLPDGRVVDVRTDVARGAETVSFTQVGGQVVNAVRYEANR